MIKYILIFSVIVNILLITKLAAMRMSVRELRISYAERKNLNSNCLLGSSSRDSEIRKLTQEMNDTLVCLREAYHRYELGDAELKTAITNIAHDLRTPLTAICGYLELSGGMERSPELAHCLDVISERAQYMKKLTEELFEYAQAAGGEIREKKQEVCINKLLENIIMDHYPAFKDRGIEPVVEICENEIRRQLYPSCTERIIQNLLSNALKYSDGDLEIILDDGGRLRVSNSSAELSSVDVNRLFDRFFTVESARNYSTGLGLSIVKLFTERMELELNAYYENGKINIEIVF